jgi:hypothetical protein
MERSALHNSLIGIPQIDLNQGKSFQNQQQQTLVKGGGSINSLEEFDNYLFNQPNPQVPGSSAGRL